MSHSSPRPPAESETLVAGTQTLSPRTLFLYAIPTVGMTAMHWLIMVFLLKYATDTLGIAPAWVGVLFAAGRFWDALSDPIAGWFSDRTQTRLGRRRPWMLVSAIPLGIGFFGLWTAPIGVSPLATAAWLAGSLLLFFTALTAVMIPYRALGAELTNDHHARTRIAACRTGAEAVGIFTAIGALHLLENAESIQATAAMVGIVMAAATTVMILYAALRLKEPLGSTARSAADPIRAVRDVLGNPHARQLAAGIIFTEIGLGSLLVAIPFATETLSEPGTSALRILGFVVPFILSVPIWIPLSRRFGKSRCYAAANGLCALSFVMIGVVGYGNFSLGLVAMLGIGASQAALRTLPDSIKADVIDWDEARTGERKEGSYFAAWNLGDKLAGVLSVALVGFFIQGEGTAVDPEGVRLVVSYVPASFMLLAMIALRGFDLDERRHSELRERIDRRNEPAQLAWEGRSA